MPDLAQLSIVVDTTGTVAGTKALDNLARSGVNAERSVTGSASRLSSGMSRTAEAAARAAHQGTLAHNSFSKFGGALLAAEGAAAGSEQSIVRLGVALATAATFGGPVMIALTAVGAAIGAIVAKDRDAEEAAKAAAAAHKEWLDGIKRSADEAVKSLEELRRVTAAKEFSVAGILLTKSEIDNLARGRELTEQIAAQEAKIAALGDRNSIIRDEARRAGAPTNMDWDSVNARVRALNDERKALADLKRDLDAVEKSRVELRKQNDLGPSEADLEAIRAANAKKAADARAEEAKNYADAVKQAEAMNKAEDEMLRAAKERAQLDALRTDTTRAGGVLPGVDRKESARILAEYERKALDIKREAAGEDATSLSLMNQIADAQREILLLAKATSIEDAQRVLNLGATVEGLNAVLAAHKKAVADAKATAAAERAAAANKDIDNEIAQLRAVTDEQRQQVDLVARIAQLRKEGASEERIAALAAAAAWRSSYDAAAAALEKSREAWRSFTTELEHTLGQGLTDLIVDGITNGFRNAQDIVLSISRQILQQVTAALIQPMIANLVGGLAGGLGGSIGGIVGLGRSFGGAFGGGVVPGAPPATTWAQSAVDSYLSGVGGWRANGGDVWPGRSFVVGERGPELFHPRTAGTILPADATHSLKQRPVTVVFNVKATDPAAFRASSGQMAADAKRRFRVR